MYPTTHYFTIKAYLPNGQLIKSKPLPISAYWEYLHLVSDCRLLGCKGYYLRDASGQRYIPIKEFSYPLISLRSVIQSAKNAA